MDFWRPSDKHSIWMFCMRFPIDVVFINDDNVVTDIFENVPPVSLMPSTWKVYKPTKPVKLILELKSGRCRRTRTKVGDRLDLNRD